MEMPVLSEKTITFINDHEGSDVRTLALQAARYSEVDVPAAIVQIAARQTARTKLPTWWRTSGIYYPHHLPMEQCSSEVTACYKARIIPEGLKRGGVLTDLSGGFGVDFVCMAKGFKMATYVERQEELCALMSHNKSLLGLPDAQVVHADGIEYLQRMPHQQVVFIDPARRDIQGRKTVAISDCEPDIKQLNSLLTEKADMVIVKLSPMLDISQVLSELPTIREVHVVAVAGECKELLLVMDKDARSVEARICCLNLPPVPPEVWPSPFLFSKDEEEESEYSLATEVGTYLFEPHAALLKAGAFRCVASRYGLQKLHSNSHLYTGDSALADFPGRSFEVIDHGGFGKHGEKKLFRYGRKMNLTVRNFPASVAELRKRLKLAEGGDDYLFATTLADGEKQWILCRKY